MVMLYIILGILAFCILCFILGEVKLKRERKWQESRRLQHVFEKESFKASNRESSNNRTSYSDSSYVMGIDPYNYDTCTNSISDTPFSGGFGGGDFSGGGAGGSWSDSNSNSSSYDSGSSDSSYSND